MENTTNYFRSQKDPEHLYEKFDTNLWNLTTDEMLIILRIFHHKTEPEFEGDKIWIVNRIEIQKSLMQRGMPKDKFCKAWMSLQKKKYIVKRRFKGGVEWTIYEAPESIINKVASNLLPKSKPNKESVKAPANIICFDTLDEMHIQRLKDNLRLYPDAPLQYQYDISKEEIRKRLNI